jgi:sugar lactone lactonase YvrE
VSFDPGRGSAARGSRFVGQIECNRPGNRTNDGKCDALGRLWIGTMDAAERAFTGALYRIDQDA